MHHSCFTGKSHYAYFSLQNNVQFQSSNLKKKTIKQKLSHFIFIVLDKTTYVLQVNVPLI